MKKRVKYIGSAVAVALLAAGAPIVVPMLMPTTTVEAFGSINYNPPLTATEMLTAFENQFNTRYVSGTKSLTTTLRQMATYNDHGPYGAFPYFNASKPEHLHDIQHDTGTDGSDGTLNQQGKGGITALKDTSKALSTMYFEDSKNDYYYRDVVGYFTISDPQNGVETLDTEAEIDDFCDRLDAGKITMPLIITLHLSTDGSYPKAGYPDSLADVPDSLKTMTFKINSSSMDITKGNSIPTIPVGSTLSDTQLTSEKNSLQITDNYTGDASANMDKMTTPTYGKSLFKTESAAIAYAKSKGFDPTSTTSGDANDALNSSGQITTGDTYYQTVSYMLKNGNDGAINYFLSGGIDLMTGATVSPYTTTVNGQAATEGTDYYLNKDAGTLTVIRPFTVSGTVDLNLDPLTVTTSTSTSDTSLTTIDGDSLSIGKTNTISSGADVTFDDKYYTDSKATVEATDINGTFDKAKTYYRKVYFKIPNGDMDDLSFPGSIDVNKDTRTVTYTQEINVLNSTSKQIATPEVTVGTSDTSSDATTGNTLNNSQGTLINPNKGDYKGVSFGNDYYQEGASDEDVLNNKVKAVDGVVDSKGDFTKTGTYLRTITFYLIDGAIDTNTFGTKEGVDYTLDQDNNTVTYVQKVSIDKLKAKQNFDTPKVAVGATSSDSKLSTPTADDWIRVGDSNGRSLVDTSLGTSGVDFGPLYSNLGLTDPVTQITKAGSYFRKVTFHIQKDLYDVIDFSQTGGITDDSDADDPTISFIQEVVASTSSTTVSFNQTISGITVGSGSDNSLLADNETETLIDDATKESLLNQTDKVTLGTTYYDSSTDALDAAQGKTVTESKNFVDNKFKKVGSYYRTITFNLKKGSAYAHTFSGSAHYVDYANDTVTYVQEINVGQETSAATIPVIDTFTGVPIDSLNVPSQYTLVGKNTGSLVAEGDNSVQFGDQYYKDPQTALDETTGVSGIAENNMFKSAGTYYRKITFSLIPDATTNDLFTEKINGVLPKVNGTTSVTYLQQIIVAQNVATATIIPPTVNADTSMSDVPSTTGNTLIDKNDKSIVESNGISFDNSVFYTKDDSGNISEVKGDKFTKAGTYYRRITFKIMQGAAAADDFQGGDVVSKTANSVTYLQPVNVVANKAAANIKGISTTAGILVTDQSLNDAAGSTITNDYGSLVQDNGISFGETYYSNSSDVINGGTSVGVENNKLIINDKNVNEKTYYRAINFKLVPDALLGNTLDGIEGKDYAVTKNNDGTETVTYAQAVTVTRDSANSIIKSTVEVKAGSSLKDDVENNDIQASGKTIVQTNGVKFGDEYYDVNNTANTPDAILGKTTTTTPEVTNNVVINGNYVKAGTYYRKITFELDKGELDAVSLPDSPEYYVNADGTVSYIQTITINPIAATVKADPASIKVGATTDELASVPKDGYVLNNGDNIIPATVTVGTEIYKSQAGAKQNSADDIDPDIKSSKKFTKAGTYYRILTFTPTDKGTAGEYSFADDNVTVNADGTISYVQAISVGQNDAVADDTVKSMAVKVDVNSSGDSKLTDTDGYKLQDKFGNSLIDNSKDDGISFSDDYYTLENGVKTPTDYAKGATITKAGTYYRQVIFKVTDNAILNNNFEAIGGTLDKTAKTVSFVQKVVASTNSASASINDVSVSNGSSDKSSILNNAKDVSVTDDKGNSIIATNGVNYGDIFDSIADAKAGSPTSSGVNKNGYFTKAGTYYQPVTITLEPNGVNAYDFGTDGIIDPKNNTVTYIRKITVNQSTNGSGGNSGNSDDEWTYYKNPGVVTTKTTQPTYTLNNHDNDTIANRGLAENTSWITDQYRTNRAGVKQYRVATGEWVDSHDVIFTSPNESGDDEWTYYQDPGVVTTKTDQDAYTLNNRANNTIANRGLAKDTPWITDQYRTNKAGVKQYRVATGEWIDSHDVIFTQNESSDGWTYYQDKGVVTTKDNQQYYSMNNQANETVGNRALSEKTSWLTDQYRTNREGVKQYRVATGEWIDSHDVIFVKDVKQIVNLDATDTYYELYDFEEHVVGNRALSKKTSWLSDKMGIDADGNTYYRVATNEWIKQIDGVHVDNYAWY